MYRPTNRSYRLKVLWRHSMALAFWRGAARLIATSETEHEGLLADGVPAEKLLLRLPLCLRGGSSRARREIPLERPLILFLSRLKLRIASDILMDSFAEMCPDSGCLVSAGLEGETKYHSYLTKHARESGVEKLILFTDPLYD